MNSKIDPWSMKEVKDYDKIRKEFGLNSFEKIKEGLADQPLFIRRDITYAHKDFERIADCIKNKKKFVLMTGLMPSGKMHLGHKLVLDQIIYYQKWGAKCYIAVADIESYLTRNISLEEAKKIAIEEYLTNYIALGLKPENLCFYFQSNWKIPYQRLSKLVASKTTFNELKSIYGDLTPEKIMSSFTQVADILHPQLQEFEGLCPVVVPVGIDQLPHLNLTRDIVSRFKSQYKFIQPSATFHKLLPSLKGINAKMSSSDTTSFISLDDGPEEAEKKINKYAFSGGQATIEEHRKKGGNPDVDVSYQWLRMLFEPDDKKLLQIHEDYKSGKLLTGELKQILIEKITDFLKEHQKRREKAKKQIDKFLL